MLNDSWMPVWGGGPGHILEVSKRLVKNYGCIVDIIVPNLTDKDNKEYPQEELLEKNLRVIRVGKKFIFPNIIGRLSYLLSALKYSLVNSYDIYHAQYVMPAMLLPIVKILKRKPVVFTLHGKPGNMLGGGILNSLKIPKMFSNFLLYVLSYDCLMSVAKSSLTRKPLFTKKTLITGNGVDTAIFDTVSGNKDKNIIKILWVGRRYDPVKGTKFLEEAIKKVKVRYPQVELSMVSNKYGDDLTQEYKSADLFVLPSLSEGLPLVLLEAMAAKLPIVTTDVGDCKKLVEEAGCGVVVKAGDAGELERGILELIGEEELREKMGEKGYKFVKENYSWDKVTERIYRAYETLF